MAKSSKKPEQDKKPEVTEEKPVVTKKPEFIRKIDVLRIRKSNTRNLLFESPDGKKFIEAARAEVKHSEIEESKEWFIVWELIEK